MTRACRGSQLFGMRKLYRPERASWVFATIRLSLCFAPVPHKSTWRRWMVVVNKQMVGYPKSKEICTIKNADE